MSELQLPALRGDSVLGFLAALGAARIVRDELGSAVRVGWPDGPYSGAVMESDFDSLDTVAEALSSVVDAMVASGQLVPGIDGFPPIDDGSGRDPLKNLVINDGRGLSLASLGDEVLDRWTHALVGMVPPIDMKSGVATHLEVNRFLRAGPGTVWAVRTLQQARDGASPDAMKSALAAWQRTDGYIGAYLDAQADVEKATGQAAKDPPKRGVHGATFLALQALPLIPVRSLSPFRSETVGWAERRGLRKGFTWPVWGALLPLASVAALLDHPVVAGAHGAHDADGRRLAALGVSAVFRSTRIAAGNNDGAMRPSQLCWERRE